MPAQIDGAVIIPEFPDQAGDDFDDRAYGEADNEFRDALRKFIRSGARNDNIAGAIEGVLEEF